MAELPIIRKGDSTSHGGVVLEGFEQFDIHGRPVAGLGHKVSCPKCPPGIHVIAQGATGRTVLDIPIALEGMLTSCGAALIPTQFTATAESGSVAPLATFARPELLGSEAIEIVERSRPHDEQPRAVDSSTGQHVAGLAYFIRRADGSTENGYTDDSGLCPRITTKAAEKLEIWFGVSALVMMHRSGA